MRRLYKIIKHFFYNFGIYTNKQSQITILSLNDQYDAETIAVIMRLGQSANCIDIGAHKGDILKELIKYCPKGVHFAFEPIPELYQYLKKYSTNNVTIYPYALSDTSGKTNFNLVITNPAYSGIIKRKYDRAHESDKNIEVEKRRLDEIIPDNIPIQFIKIDVEGAEYLVLKGAQRLLKKHMPVIVFEQGLGAADVYETNPKEFYEFMTSYGYSISTMQYYLRGLLPLSCEEYCNQYNKAYNYYFIAYSSS